MDMNAAAQQMARRIRRLFASNDTPPAPAAPELEWSPSHLPREDADFAPIWDLWRPYTMHLYPQLCDKSVLIVDDDGHWAGSRKAVDEYFDHLRAAGGHAPLPTVIDCTGRMAVK